MKQCEICENEIPKRPKLSYKQYHSRRFCSNRCSASTRELPHRSMREYYIWRNMNNRCKDVTNRWYGSKGVTVCKRWASSFENFILDMGESPSDLHSIDRIDSNGNYEPTNCRWATAKEQAANRSKPTGFSAEHRRNIAIGIRRYWRDKKCV